MAKTASRRVRNYCSQCYVPACDFRGPCRFPHGCCYSILGIFSAVGGLMMNYYVLGSCFFQRVQQVNHVTGDPIPGSERGYGFLSRETDYGVASDYAECTWYPQAEYDAIFDGWFQSGRIFAFMSAMLATICFTVMLLTCCVAFSTSMFERWLFWMYIVAALCIALSFLAFGNEWCAENDCKVADGSGWAISAFMFHLVSANTVKSFPGPSAPPSRGSEDDDLADDDELDDLYYEDEQSKYPPPHPDGPRGVSVKKNGEREYDNGEDYYDEMGRLVKDPNDPNRDKKRSGGYQDNPDDDDSDINSADLDDISDHDLDDYDSDKDDDEEKGKGKNKAKPKYDAYGNPIFDPSAPDDGNLGVGYEQDGRAAPIDEFGKPVSVDEYGNPVQQVDEFGNPVQPLDAFGNPLQVDEFGIPIHHHDEPHQQQEPSQYAAADEFGNPIPEQQRYGGVDEYGQPLSEQQPYGGAVDEFGNPMPQQEQTQYDEFGNPMPQQEQHPQYDEFGIPMPQQEQPQYDEFGNPMPQQEQQQYTHGDVDEFGNPIQSEQQYAANGGAVDDFGNPIPLEQQYDQQYDQQQELQFDQYGNPIQHNRFADDNDDDRPQIS